MFRRKFLFTLSSAIGLLATRSFADDTSEGNKVNIMRFSDEGKPLGRVALAKVNKGEEWRKVLSPLAYQVTREQGTELAFSQAGYSSHDQGLYRCICCDNALFDSNSKFDSHTGWPSFWEPIATENVHEIGDHKFGIPRTEIQCSLCDAHLGHVFNDGPEPTGLRYCMNTVAMRFVAHS